jgi:glycosyltransferase involved in cell wall biosynthesis
VSVLSQSYSNIKIFCIDDCSTDNSRDIITKLSNNDPRLHTIFLDKNIGPLQIYKLIFNLLDGEYVYGLAADDWLANNNFFYDAIEAFSTNSKVVGFFGKTQIVNALNDELIGEMGLSPKVGLIEPVNFVDYFLLGKVFVPGSSAIWRMKEFKELGGYPSNLGPKTDYFVNHMLPTSGPVIFSDKFYSNFRVWINKRNYGSSDSVKVALDRLCILESMFKNGSNLFVNAKYWREWRRREFLITRFSDFKALFIVKDFIKEIFPDRIFIKIKMSVYFIIDNICGLSRNK